MEVTGVITGEVASKISHEISYGSCPPEISIEIPSVAPNSQLTPSEISYYSKDHQFLKLEYLH